MVKKHKLPSFFFRRSFFAPSGPVFCCATICAGCENVLIQQKSYRLDATRASRALENRRFKAKMAFESKSTFYMVGWETRWKTTTATISTWVGLNKLNDECARHFLNEKKTTSSSNAVFVKLF